MPAVTWRGSSRRPPVTPFDMPAGNTMKIWYSRSTKGMDRLQMKQEKSFALKGNILYSASPEAIHDYFYQLLVLKGKQAQDSQNILPLLEDGTLPFRTVAQRFHLIDTPTRTVYIPLEGGEMLVERLRQGERSRSLFRQLGQYGVSVYEQHYRALEQAGDLEVLEDGSAVLWNTERYSEQTGLSLTADDGKFLNI